MLAIPHYHVSQVHLWGFIHLISGRSGISQSPLQLFSLQATKDVFPGPHRGLRQQHLKTGWPLKGNQQVVHNWTYCQKLLFLPDYICGHRKRLFYASESSKEGFSDHPTTHPPFNYSYLTSRGNIIIFAYLGPNYILSYFSRSSGICTCSMELNLSSFKGTGTIFSCFWRWFIKI